MPGLYYLSDEDIPSTTCPMSLHVEVEPNIVIVFYLLSIDKARRLRCMNIVQHDGDDKSLTLLD